MIKVTCPHCGASFEVDHEYFGQYVECGVCAKGFIAGQKSPNRTTNELRTNSKANLPNSSFQKYMPSLKKCASIPLFVVKIGIMVLIPFITLGNLSNSYRDTYSYRFESRRSIEESFAIKQAKVLCDISDNVDAVATKCDAIALLLLFPCMAFTYRVLFPSKKEKN